QPQQPKKQSAKKQSAQKQNAPVSAKGRALSELSGDQVRQLQRELAGMDLYDGPVDGIVGPKTREALQKFHAQEEIEGAEVGPETLDALGIEWETMEAEPVSGTDEESSGMAEPSREDVRAQPGTDPGAQQARLSSLGKARTKQIQGRLKELGFYKGEIDGQVGQQTLRALSRYFYRQAELANEGQVTMSGIAALEGHQGEMQPVSGTESPAPSPPRQPKSREKTTYPFRNYAPAEGPDAEQESAPPEQAPSEQAPSEQTPSEQAPQPPPTEPLEEW
ncbi:MAG TPA: peptidoglycan-binding protein, partial [Polyangiaceae bacterium]